MKFAIIGGTHGNELTGIEVVSIIKNHTPKDCLHSYKTFIGNPKAYEQKKRFIDSDLNRAFGINGFAKGQEKKRSKELIHEIQNNFDFLVDIHSTTTNMGLTIVLNRNDKISIQAACYLQNHIPEIKLITTEKFNEDCPYTNAMIGSGFIIEVGAVPHNVLSAYYIRKVYDMITLLLRWDFKEEIQINKRQYYQSCGVVNFPSQEGFYIHPHIETNSFKEIKPGDPLFVNIKGETLPYEGETSFYPFFVNEASYQDLRLAMSMATLECDLERIL